MSCHKQCEDGSLLSQDSAGYCHERRSTTESKDSFTIPRPPKQLVTRENRFEQFLWHELYNEYLKAMKNRSNLNKIPEKSEYVDRYGRSIPSENKQELDELIRKYPVYGSEALSIWNPDLSKPTTFKQHQQLTKRIDERASTFSIATASLDDDKELLENQEEQKVIIAARFVYGILKDSPNLKMAVFLSHILHKEILNAMKNHIEARKPKKDCDIWSIETF